MTGLSKRKMISWVCGCTAALLVAIFLMPAAEKAEPSISLNTISQSLRSVSAGTISATHSVVERHVVTPPDSPSVITENPADLFNALFSPNPEARLKALDSIWQFPAAWIDSGELTNRLEIMTTDDDSRVAEQAQLVLLHLANLRSAEDQQKGQLRQDGQSIGLVLEPEPVRTGGMTDEELATAAMAVAGEPGYFSRLRERALHHTDPDVRMRAVEEAMTRHDERVVSLLAEAMRDDFANIRMLAVDGLAQISAKGAGDSQQIMAILERAAVDMDQAVAELAQQAIKDQPTQSGQSER